MEVPSTGPDCTPSPSCYGQPMRLTCATLIASVLFLASCGDDASPVDSGAPPDGAAVDATTDAAPDAAADAAIDAAADATAEDTWTTFAMEFFASYCTECHDGDPRDYRTIDDVVRDAATIRCGVSDVMASGCGTSPAPMQFPIGTGPRPTVEERQRLVAWIDAGLPE